MTVQELLNSLTFDDIMAAKEHSPQRSLYSERGWIQRGV